MKKRFLLTSALCACLMFSMSGCITAKDSGPVTLSVETECIPEYYHYEPEDFYAKCDEMTAAANDGDFEKVRTLYPELYYDIAELMDLNLIINTRYYEDISDTYLEEENLYTQNTLIDCYDYFCISCREVMHSPVADGFRILCGADSLADSFYDYEDMSQEEKDLESREKDLVNQYTNMTLDLSVYTTTIDGKTYSLEYILSDDALALAMKDFDLYLEALNGTISDFNSKAGPIYLELVDIRTQKARLNGYDNYADYADEKVYLRDYNAKDLEALKATTKKYAPEISALNPGFESDERSSGELVYILGILTKDISKPVTDSYELFRDNRLYSIGYETERMDVGFTSRFFNSKMPFIFIKQAGTVYDTATICHEFGHFVYSAQYEKYLSIFSDSSLDLNEIHSNGLELLTAARYDKIFDEKTIDKAYLSNLSLIFSNISEGCLYDEWQRWVYENPDSTLDEINEKFRELSLEYYGEAYYLDGFEWVFVSHNFDSPMYYISYATSAYTALQLWDMSLEDFDGAIDIWDMILRGTACDGLYMSVIKNTGLKTFADADNVEKVIKETYMYMLKNS